MRPRAGTSPADANLPHGDEHSFFADSQTVDWGDGGWSGDRLPHLTKGDSRDHGHRARGGRGRTAPRNGFARVFVCEDDDDMRLLVAEVFRQDGYDVVEMRDGRETLEGISRAFQFPIELPDLIVMDLLMPHCSGLGILTALRRANWRTPVIVITGFSHGSVLDRARDLGAAAVLRKPFSLDELRAAALESCARA